MLASVNPVCRAYDPAFAYEAGVIIEDGIRRMYGEDEDVFYYLTLYNENYAMPPKPDGVDKGILDGLYRYEGAPEAVPTRVAILFSGTANLAARTARDELAEHYGVAAELWSVTSYKALREQALEVERWNRLHPRAEPLAPYVTHALGAVGGPIVAVTDFMRLVPDQIAPWVPGTYVTLGTDGFGRSDSRPALRRFFEVDAGHVVVATLAALAREQKIDPATVEEAMHRYDVDPEAPAPWTV